MEKVGNYLKEDLAKPGYKSKHESTKRSGWLEWRSHRLPTSLIYKSKCGVCLSVRLSVCLSVCGDKQGRAGAGQGSRCGGPGEVPFLLKKSLGKIGGPTSNQTKIQFFKKIIFIIEHI